MYRRSNNITLYKTFWGALATEQACRGQKTPSYLAGVSKSCVWKEMESLLGHLSNVTTVIHPVHRFLRPLFCTLAICSRAHHHIRLNLSIWVDLHQDSSLGSKMAFHCFHQGRHQSLSTQMHPAPVDVEHLTLYTSQLHVAARFNLQWPSVWETTDIAVKELVQWCYNSTYVGPAET